MFRSVTIFAGLGLAALAALPSSPAGAQVQPPQAGFVGRVASSQPGCPGLVWRLARHPDGKITGIVYYGDMSGFSMANGTVDQSGNFSFTLTPSMGNGPIGQVQGTKNKDGSAQAVLAGQGCANATVRVLPVDDMNAYHLGQEGPGNK